MDEIQTVRVIVELSGTTKLVVVIVCFAVVSVAVTISGTILGIK